MRTWSKVLLISFILLFAFNAYAGDGGVDSKFKMKLYGFVRAETIYDNTQIFSGDWMLFAYDKDAATADRSVFTMSARHTRLGTKIMMPDIDGKMKVQGLIEVDFAGGFAESTTGARQPYVRLRHAWVEMYNDTWALRFGQDWALISGPFPATNQFVVGAAVGNPWMRMQQIKFTYKMDKLTFAASIDRPISSETKYINSDFSSIDYVDAGELSGMPFIFGRVWYDMGKVKVSAYGHYGSEKVWDAAGEEFDVATFSAMGDIGIDLGALNITVKGFMGENLNCFLAGILQGIGTEDGDLVGIPTMGGWGQAKYTINEKYWCAAGYGMEDPDDDLAPRFDKNDWMYGVFGYNYNKALSFNFGVDYLKTTYAEAWTTDEEGDNLRFSLLAVFKF